MCPFAPLSFSLLVTLEANVTYQLHTEQRAVLLFNEQSANDPMTISDHKMPNSNLGPESYDRDVRYRHGLLSTTIS